MTQNPITRQELDSALDPAGSAPDSFGKCAAGLLATGRDLEIRDPREWRRPGTATAQCRASFLEQFRRDVESIILQDREDEARLARGIEFAGLRFAKVRDEHQLSAEAVDEGLAHPGLGWSLDAAEAIREYSELPSAVTQRWIELHALRTEMVERNLYLVPINVERYTKMGSSRTDLTQEGCLSLFRAVDGFDWRRGLLFRTYAVHWLNQAFRSHLYNFGSTVRVPVYLQKAMKHVASARMALGKEKASVDEIAQAGELEPRLVRSAIKASRASFSLDAEMGRGTGNRLGDLLEDRKAQDAGMDGIDHAELAMCFYFAFQELSSRERDVLHMRFGLGACSVSTLAEVAREMDLSIERVRQVQLCALRKLGAPAARRSLEVFLN